MRYISELIDKKRNVRTMDGSVLLKDRNRIKPENSVNLLALGDVGGTVLLGLRLLGGAAIREIGIYDINDNVMRRYEREINQVFFPDGRALPHVRILEEKELFNCDMFVFCASKGVPPVGASGDVRMAQLEANRGLVSMYAERAAKCGFDGIFAVVSDPVDPLCKAALLAGLAPEQVQGYGLGVMNGRAAYFAEKSEGLKHYLKDGRAFGPHGEDLVIADSVTDYDDEISRELTRLTVSSNMETRADGFKPYIAPAMSSGAISLIETLSGGWNYSSVFLGAGASGAFLGCRNRRTEEGIQIENLPIDEKLFQRIEKAYDNLKELL